MPATATRNGLLPAALLAPPLMALSTGSAEASIPCNEGPTLTATTTLSKTRVRASDFLAEDDVRTESGVSPGLLKGSTPTCAGNVSGPGEFRIFDPQDNPLSVSAYGWTRLFQGREYISMLDAYDFRARTLWPELGRFGQEDPAHSDQHLSTYQALNGSWTNVTDPTGLYAKDFHFYAVYFLARAQGFDRGMADDVAWASQYVDNAPFSRPDGMKGLYRGALWPSRNQAFHFLAPGRNATRRDNSIANVLARDAISTANPIRFGIALHTYADTYAHEGFSAYWREGNLRSGPVSTAAYFASTVLGVASEGRLNIPARLAGHIGEMERGVANDLPYNNVEKAIDASRSLYLFMEQFGIRYYGLPTQAMPFAQIEGVLREGFSNRQFEERDRIKKWQTLIRDVFHEDVSYDVNGRLRSTGDIFIEDQYRKARELLDR